MSSLSWTPLHAQLHRTLRERQLLPQGQRAIVAVSGGQDSLCLVRLLLDLQPKWNWELAIAHCNHRWRQDATANAAYVAQLAQNWQIPCYQATAPTVPASEAAAREWRYQVLADLAIQHGYGFVVTGHTASDRAETLLYNLMRGSGSDGLQALAWRRALAADLWLVRPLLDITRTATAQFCQDAQLQIWEDTTNQDWHYARNRIRQELLPYLQTHFNPQVEQALAQTAELLQAEVEYLEAEAAELWQKAEDRNETSHAPLPTPHSLLPTPRSPHRIHRLSLKTAPLALQRRVMRQFLQAILLTAPSFAQIEKLVSLISAANRSQTDPFPGGAIAQVEGEWIVVKSRTDDHSASDKG